MFSARNPARTALLTAHWDPPEALKQDLEPFGCRYHHGQAFDVFQPGAQGETTIRHLSDQLAPVALFQLDHEAPEFLRNAGA
jgi:hypothetical protein